MRGWQASAAFKESPPPACIVEELLCEVDELPDSRVFGVRPPRASLIDELIITHHRNGDDGVSPTFHEAAWRDGQVALRLDEHDDRFHGRGRVYEQVVKTACAKRFDEVLVQQGAIILAEEAELLISELATAQALAIRELVVLAHDGHEREPVKKLDRNAIDNHGVFLRYHEGEINLPVFEHAHQAPR